MNIVEMIVVLNGFDLSKDVIVFSGDGYGRIGTISAKVV